ncbi:hypothetical protein [Sorangium sp. So ce362]|uniref:hypothetical protein n=1 Tax=Sorangium sp. So ce362 TaxID=3133303 RepID=UPI003F63DB1E
MRSVTWSIIGTDETTTAADYTLSQSGSVGQTVSFTAGSAGTAGILRAAMNGGVDLQTELADESTRATATHATSEVPKLGGTGSRAMGQDVDIARRCSELDHREHRRGGADRAAG